MQRTVLIAFFLLLAASLRAETIFDSLPFFSGEKSQTLEVVSEAEAAEAVELLERGKAAFEEGRFGRAKRLLKRVSKRYPTADAAAEARFLQGRILMTKGRYVKAFETLQEVLQRHPEYENFDRVISSQFDCATALMEGARSRIFGIIPAFRQFNEAIAQFERIVQNAPYSDWAPLSLMNVALLAQDRDQPEEAIDALDRLINFYPQSMLAPDAYYNLAQTYADLVQGAAYDQGATRQAISYYEDFLILFPESNYVGEVEAELDKMENLLATSRFNLGDFYYLFRSNNTAALVFYNEAITIAPESEAADEARTRIADIEAGVRPATGSNLLRALLLAD